MFAKITKEFLRKLRKLMEVVSKQDHLNDPKLVRSEEKEPVPVVNNININNSIVAGSIKESNLSIQVSDKSEQLKIIEKAESQILSLSSLTSDEKKK